MLVVSVLAVTDQLQMATGKSSMILEKVRVSRSRKMKGKGFYFVQNALINALYI